MAMETRYSAHRSIGWETVRIADVARLASGGTPSKGCAKFWNGPIPWASPKDLKRPYLFDTEDHVSEQGAKEGSRIVPTGSLFIVIRGMILAKDIPIAMAMVPMAFNQDMKAIIPGDRIEADFLLFAMRAFKDALMPDIGVAAHGTRRILSSSIEDFRVPLPAIEEQRRIADLLKKLQSAVAAQQSIMEWTAELKSSLLQKLFAEGTHGEPTSEAKFGRVPSSWSIESLDKCAVVQTGVAKGRKLNGDVVLEVPYLRVANVQDGHLDLGEVKTIRLRDSELPRYQLRTGDVLLTEGGDFDKLGRGFTWEGQIDPCVHQNHIFAVRVDRTRLYPSFISYLCQSPYGKAYFLSVAHRTTNLACINTAKLKALPVLIPSLAEQREIVEILDSVQASLFAARRRRDLHLEMFTVMLDELMTGRIRVDDSSLTDITGAT